MILYFFTVIKLTYELLKVFTSFLGFNPTHDVSYIMWHSELHCTMLFVKEKNASALKQMECLVYSSVSFPFAQAASWTLAHCAEEISLWHQRSHLHLLFLKPTILKGIGAEGNFFSCSAVKEANNGVLDSFSTLPLIYTAASCLQNPASP